MLVMVIQDHSSNEPPGLAALLRSAQPMQQRVEEFLRQNCLCAKYYEEKLCKELARRGWFIASSLYVQQYPHIAKALEQGQEDEVEEFLKTHVRRLITDVRSSACDRWPNRAHILSDAFDAHSAEHYTLSIPVFLAQADGISNHLLNTFLFIGQGKKVCKAAKTLKKDSRFADRPLAQAFLDLLLQISGLGLQTEKRDKLVASGEVYSPLNRHGVIHGVDCDYPTEANSLRCVALISYLDWFAEVLQKESEQDPQ
jgi:hypothetical protein